VEDADADIVIKKNNLGKAYCFLLTNESEKFEELYSALPINPISYIFEGSMPRNL